MDKYYCKSLCFLILMLIVTRMGEAQLMENFYSSSCPNVEAIVRQVVRTKINQTFVTIPATLRLYFHDCFVEVATLMHSITFYYFFYKYLVPNTFLRASNRILLEPIEPSRGPFFLVIISSALICRDVMPLLLLLHRIMMPRKMLQTICH